MVTLVTESMSSLAIKSIPTTLRVAQDSRDPQKVFRMKRIFALLPPDHWDYVKQSLQGILGDALDGAELEDQVNTARQQFCQI